jgi:hypothetical protein
MYLADTQAGQWAALRSSISLMVDVVVTEALSEDRAGHKTVRARALQEDFPLRSADESGSAKGPIPVLRGPRGFVSHMRGFNHKSPQ